MRWLVPLLLIVAILPVPNASAASWSVDAVVAVTSGTSADFSWKISGLSNTRLKLPLPDGGTFVEARDDQGRTLTASASATEVEVTAGSRPFTITFSLQGEDEGPFVSFPAQVAAASDSPVTIGITLPAGWSLAGYRDNDDERPDSTGTFRRSGPAFVQFLAMRPGFTDTGPDTRVSGQAVRREAFANVSLTGTEWTLVTTYDTDVYSRDWEVNLPEGARLARAYTSLGDLVVIEGENGLKVHTPYPVGFGLGARSFTVEMTLRAPDVHAGAFRQANLSVRAAVGDTVLIHASLPEASQYAGSRVSGGLETAPLRYAANGPMSVGIALLPGPRPDHVQFEEGLFIVDTPRALEGAARATARNASELLPRVASFGFDATSADRPFYVAYSSEDIFGWEEGFYSNGLNTITIRASTLANISDTRPHLVPVGVLVHEATHGLVDRRIPDAPHNLSFLHEGLSRLAETRTETYFASEILVCEKQFLSQHCDRHSARPAADDEPQAGDLRERYLAGATFDIAWGANGVSDDVRGALYDYSGLVLHAFVRRAPPGALENAIEHIARTTFSGPDANDASNLLDIFLANAPGTSAQAFLYPSAQAATLKVEQFRHCMGPLLAPAYPWEDTRAPGGGCPETGYGSQDAALPSPPTQTTTTPAPSSPTPVAPPPRISPPLTVTTPEGREGEGETPGAEVEPSPKRPVDVEIPGAGAFVALAAFAVGALMFGRRR